MAPPCFFRCALDHHLDGSPVVEVERPEVDELVGQGSALVARPGGECRAQRPRSIMPVWRASRPKSRSRDGSDEWGMEVARNPSRTTQ